MKKQSILFVMAVLIIMSMVMAACAPAAPAAAPEAATKKVVLIGNQRFGDMGPMDSMAAGLDKCASEYGYEIRKVESESPSEYEDDVRGVAKEGYDLILTTFPQMQEVTNTVAKEYKDTKFAGVFQFTNVSEVEFKNVWSTEYAGASAAYLIGMLGTQMSTTKKIGIIGGQEDPAINAEINGFIKGVTDNCPECTVEVAFANSYEDPAKGKEITLAMISRGVDFVQTWCGKTSLGVIEGAKEGNILVSGEISDNSELYPEGFVTYMGINFGANVVEACSDFANDSFKGGKHTAMGLENGGYYVAYDVLERYASANADFSEIITNAIKLLKEKQDEFVSGSLVLEKDSSSPKSVKGSN